MSMGLDAGSLRIASLPGGRTLEVRRTVPADADGLERLYADLDQDDRYRRFFSLYRPPRATIEEWASDNDRGKLRLAAVIRDDQRRAGPEGGPLLVADALCVPLPDGDGEFALTVAADWRGWLGPYLLDALAEAAAALGMPNLQADILTENRRMLAVVAARGYAVLSRPDFNEIRVTTGATGTTPGWPGRHDRSRVLIEAGRTHSPFHVPLAAAGLQVITCPGPGRRCPALRGRACPLAGGADALLFALPPGDATTATLACAHERLHPAVPLCVVDRPDADGSVAPPGARHLRAASLVDDLMSALQEDPLT